MNFNSLLNITASTDIPCNITMRIWPDHGVRKKEDTFFAPSCVQRLSSFISTLFPAESLWRRTKRMRGLEKEKQRGMWGRRDFGEGW